MKHNKLIIFYICLVISVNLFAENNTFLKGGINISNFRNSDSHSKINYSIAISKIKKINKNLYFLPEISFIKQGVILKNKPVKNDDWEWYLNSYDIKIIQYYLELPMLIGYKFDIRNFKIIFYFGPSFKITITDRTKLTNEKVIYDDDHPEKRNNFKNYNFEFIQGDYSGGHFLDSPGINLHLGIALPINKKFYLEMRYSNSLTEIGSVGQLLPLKRKLYSLNFIIGINF